MTVSIEYLLIGVSLLEGLLLGAIISSTDAAAVFAILRSKRVSLRGHLKPLLELESGSNDPMAVFLTVSLIHLLKNPTAPVLAPIPNFALQLVLGALLGYGFGKAAVFLVNRLKLEYEGLYPVVTLSMAVLTYGATSFLGGSGFLAVYVAGLPKAEAIFNLVFFIVLTSALIQGTTIPWVANILKVGAPLLPQRHSPLELENTESINAELVEFIIPYNAAVAGKSLVELDLPRDSLITLICRNDAFLVPGGSTVLEEGDVVQVLSRQKETASP